MLLFKIGKEKYGKPWAKNIWWTFPTNLSIAKSSLVIRRNSNAHILESRAKSQHSAECGMGKGAEYPYSAALHIGPLSAVICA
jgi:hypothetical protein